MSTWFPLSSLRRRSTDPRFSIRLGDLFLVVGRAYAKFLEFLVHFSIFLVHVLLTTFSWSMYSSLRSPGPCTPHYVLLVHVLLTTFSWSMYSSLCSPGPCTPHYVLLVHVLLTTFSWPMYSSLLSPGPCTPHYVLLAHVLLTTFSWSM